MTTDNASAGVLNDLAPTGVLRAAVNFGNAVLAQRDEATGEAGGVSVDLVRELGRRLGVEVQLVPFDNAGKLFSAIAAHAWDVASLAVDPTRAEEVLFTSPYVLIDGTYLVRDDSPLKDIGDVDREGVRIAVAKGSALELYLARNVKLARLEPRASASEAFSAFIDEGFDALAGVRDGLEGYTRRHPGLAVMRGRFMAIPQAMGTLKGRDAGARYLQSFIDEMKRSGFIAGSLKRSAQSAAVAD